MSNLWIRESFVNATLNHCFGKGKAVETQYDDLGELYRALRDEYGRCISAVYVDTVKGTKKIGWVFQSRQKYEDADEVYLREVWVTVLQAPPADKTTYQYVDFPR